MFIPVLVPAWSRLKREERAAAQADPFSEREREVLRLLALGHTNQEIAQAALHFGAHGGIAPSAHHAEATPRHPGRARPVRALARPAG